MVFVDLLTSQLFTLGIVGLITAAMTIRSLFLYKSGNRHYRSLKGGAIILAALGSYIFISGIYGQLFWPLPGSYNILFYDLFPLVGLLFIGLLFSLRSDIDTQNVGLLGLLLGALAIYYGYSGYILKLTSAPLAMFGLYLLFGLAGILSYPVTVMLDRSDFKIKQKWVGWSIITLLFLAVLIMGSLLAIVIGLSAIPVHLSSPP